MKYFKGDASISVEQVDGFGKNKGLWVGTGNSMLKVASFGNDKKVALFCRYVEYLFGFTDEKPEDDI